MRATLRLCITAVLFGFFAAGRSCPVSAQEVPRTHLDNHPARSLVDLPASVHLPEKGRLGLWADYPHASDGRVTLTLINRTHHPIKLYTQGGDPFVKLEGQTHDGRWERAQRHHYSFCGNGYNNPSLPPGCFLTLTAPFPSVGESRPVRYRFYEGIEAVSNVTSGHVDPAEVAAAGLDFMTLQHADFARLEALLREPKNAGQPWAEPQFDALKLLDKFPAAQTAPLLRELLVDFDPADPAYEPLLHRVQSVNPAAWRTHVQSVLTGPPTEARLRLLKILAEQTGNGLDDLLLALARRPDEPELNLILRALGRLDGPTAAPGLAAIAADLRYSPDARRLAAYVRETRWDADPRGITLESEVVDQGAGLPRSPGLIRVTVRNNRPAPVSFTYRDLSDLFSFWVMNEEGTGPRPLRSGMDLSGPSLVTDTGSHVTLDPGDTRSWTVNLLDYLEPPADASRGEFGFSARCRLPGLHELPITERASASVRVR